MSETTFISGHSADYSIQGFQKEQCLSKKTEKPSDMLCNRLDQFENIHVKQYEYYKKSTTLVSEFIYKFYLCKPEDYG